MCSLAISRGRGSSGQARDALPVGAVGLATSLLELPAGREADRHTVWFALLGKTMVRQQTADAVLT